MSRSVPAATRELAAHLNVLFAQDAALVRRLNQAQQRLRSANDRLSWDLHPDGLAAIYSEDPAAVDVAFAEHRSEALGAPDPLAAIQRVQEHPQRIPHLSGSSRGTPPARRRAPGGRLDRGAGAQRQHPPDRNEQPSKPEELKMGTTLTPACATAGANRDQAARQREGLRRTAPPSRRSTLAQRPTEDGTTSNASEQASSPRAPRGSTYARTRR